MIGLIHPHKTTPRHDLVRTVLAVEHVATLPCARWLMLIMLSMLMLACEPLSDTKLSNSPTAHDSNKHDELAHGANAIRPPTAADNAKITLSSDQVTLTKAHIMSIKTERYQPAFRLEGIIIPATQGNITLPKDGKLAHLYVNVGDTIKKGDKVAKFYQEIPQEPTTSKDILGDELLRTTEQIQSTPKQTPVQTHSIKNDDTAHSSTDRLAPTQDSQATSQHLDEIESTPPIHTVSFDVISTLSGKVHAVFATDNTKTYRQHTPILAIHDERFMKFISPLPEAFAKYLAIGDGVNFNTDDGRMFSGQIEQILPNPSTNGMMEIHVAIMPSQTKQAGLTLGEHVSGYVNYGQIDVGILVPAFAIFDNDLNGNLTPMDLSALSEPPYKPAIPKPAWLWSIGQDEKLALSSIFVIEYRPQSEQYLISGVTLDGLIALANLPKSAHGAQVRLK